jgi:hypothetical protein
MSGLVTPRRTPGEMELERLVAQVRPALAARLRLEALRAWQLEVRRITVHPRYLDEEREEFVQTWIGARLEEAIDVALRVAPAP